MAMGVTPTSGTIANNGTGNNNNNNNGNNNNNPTGSPSNNGNNSGNGMNMGQANSSNSLSASANANGGHPDSLMQQNQNGGMSRQQQIQQQKLIELEKQQKELEAQRQQLLAGIQDPGSGNMMDGNNSSLSLSMPPQQNMGGLGSGNPPGMSRMPPAPNQPRPSQDGGSLQQQWWICQVCNVKAFASRDEAMQHEAVCNERNRNVSKPPVAPPMPQHNAFNTLGGMNQPEVGGGSDVQPNNSNDGPFTSLPRPRPLAMEESDKDWLTPLHCFVRRHCVEVFCASDDDVATPSKGKRKPIQVGQVGIRCPHCHQNSGGAGQRERGSVYYPTTISSIYNATMNLLQRHLHSCTSVPREMMEQYQNLKGDDARSGTSKKYWIESALSLGLVDTPNGIRFSARTPPPLPRLSRQQHSTGMFSAKTRNSNDFFSSQSNANLKCEDEGDLDDPTGQSMSPAAVTTDRKDSEGDISQSAKALSESAPLVTPEDKPYATEFSYHLLSQMQQCVFTEADRLGKRKGLPAGFAGLACRHCFGGYGSGRFFPSSIKTLSDTSKTLNVLHNHMTRCRKCPKDVKDTLEKLREHHDDERAKMKFGSQKAFFAKIWARLHEGNPNVPNAGTKRKVPPSYAEMQQKMKAPSPHMMNPMGQLPPSHPQLMGLDVMARQAESDAKRQRMGL